MRSVESGVLEEFLAAAREYPERPAIAGSGRHLSYAELAARVRAVALRLRLRHRHWHRPGVVGVQTGRSADTIAGLLGVWAAGGTYCPVDPVFPAPRRQAMLRAAGCRLLLGPGLELTAVPDAPAVDQAPAPAYTLFTSGSTGEPKPVLTPHRAIAVTVRSLRDLFGLTPADRVLQFASQNWDTCFEEILPTLTCGACLVFHNDAYAGSFPRFLRMLELERITVLNLPTAFWHELVNYLIEEGSPLPDCVRLVIIGGEPVSPARLADWRGLQTGQARLLNTYGCTETTLITHAIDLSAESVEGLTQVPIGRPLPHVRQRITDEGELLIGGPALATGYRDRPAETQARFVTIGRHRYFRTGDRVARLPDGTLVPQGRIDAQLKIRGVRVDPAEVEAQLASHPAVKVVAATGVRVADHTVLVAYVVARPLVATAALDVRLLDYLRGRVPAHLVPSRIHVVTELAYTASGKVDRHAIKEAQA